MGSYEEHKFLKKKKKQNAKDPLFPQTHPLDSGLFSFRIYGAPSFSHDLYFLTSVPFGACSIFG